MIWLIARVVCGVGLILFSCFFFFQAEDGIRDLVRSRGLGDVYKRQAQVLAAAKGVSLVRSHMGSAAIDQFNCTVAP